MIDLHTHLLPGIDDGPATEEGALAMARRAVAGGIDTMAATPHLDRGYGLDPASIGPAVERLEERLAAEGVPVRVVGGAEVALARYPGLSDADLRAVVLGEGRCILLECPLGPEPYEDLAEAVLDLRGRGFDVLLAHPERCPLFLRDPDGVDGLVDAGALCSVTAGALAGRFGRAPRALGLRLLADGLVHNVASDAHDDRRRPPDLLSGLAAAEDRLNGVEALVGWLTRDLPAALLAGRPLPAPPPVRTQRPLLSRLRRG